MIFKNIALSMSALALAATPVVASAADAQVARSTEATADVAEMGGSSVIIALLAAAAVIAGIIVAVDGGNDGDAVSP